MKSHTIRTHEQPLVVTPGAIRIELSCPSGCIKGYVWSQSEERNEEIRAAVRLIAEAHAEGSRP